MCNIKTANELLEMILLGCYKIELKGKLLEVSPAFSIDNEMADLIRLHKAEIIKILERETIA
jgi:hypothetical protein